MAAANLVICKYCDSVYQRTPLGRREIARCAQCGAELYHYRQIDVDTMLALTVASLFAFVIANIFPIAMLEAQGRSSEANLWQAIIASFRSGAAPIGALAATTVFFFPLLQLCLFAYVLLPLRLAQVPSGFNWVMHALRQMQPWAMVEVFMLGVLVAVVKLGDVATVTPLAGTWGFALLTLLLTLLNSYDLRELWDRASALNA
ncbi:MAG: paraquat-inducible protein [Nevskia sp.]|nr:paraquat-inducible protein [Nevskia sp.]